MSWINGSGFIPNGGLNGTAAPWATPGSGTAGPYPAGSPGYLSSGQVNGDRFRPAWFGGSTLPGGAINPSASSGIGAILAQLASQVQQSIARLGSAIVGSSSAGASPPPTIGAATFQNVNLASVGDPHLGVNGTELNADGSTASVSSNFDSMTGHADLFSSRDFGDGFRVSTTVTQANANGVTQNASATASMDFGRESVTMTGNGTISINDHGQSIALTPGQSTALSGGQQVSEGADGSVTISENGFGENLTTTFTANGGGVDVTAQGQNITLAGDLITGGTTPVAQSPANVRSQRVVI
jgi:hypothetical protein